MRFETPLERARLLRRYKRFFADVVTPAGEELTVHVPNPGAMLGCNAPGLDVWLSRSDKPTRKLPHTLEMVEADGVLVGVNTMAANRLVAEALQDGVIAELAGYKTVRREVNYGSASRVDFLLSSPDRPPCWLEVKNCQLKREPGLAEFPDCVSARGLKHLDELEAMVAKGDRAAMLFIIQRTDCDAFSAAHDIDPKYSAGLERAARAGVQVLSYACALTPEEISVARPLTWRRPDAGAQLHVESGRHKPPLWDDPTRALKSSGVGPKYRP